MAINLDISSIVKCMDIDMLRRASYYRVNDLIYNRIGNAPTDDFYIKLIGESGNQVEVTNCSDLQVDEGIRKVATDDEITINNTTPTLVRVVAGDNLENRKTVLIQPLNGKIRFGFSASSQSFQLTSGNFFEIKVNDTIDIYMIGTKAGNAPTRVAVGEFK